MDKRFEHDYVRRWRVLAMLNYIKTHLDSPKLPQILDNYIKLAGDEMRDSYKPINAGNSDIPPKVTSAETPKSKLVYLWIQDNTDNWLTPGGDPVWKCPVCGGSRHVYGIENNYPKQKCDECGTEMSGYWRIIKE